MINVDKFVKNLAKFGVDLTIEIARWSNVV